MLEPVIFKISLNDLIHFIELKTSMCEILETTLSFTFKNLI